MRRDEMQSRKWWSAVPAHNFNKEEKDVQTEV